MPGDTSDAGRRVLITGGGGGIGRACAVRLAGDGWDVIVTDSSTEALDSVNPGTAIARVRMDVTDSNSVRRVVEESQPVDVVVNCAGILGRGGSLTTMQHDEWVRVVDVNLGGTLRVMHAALPFMIDRGWGRIVNIASLSGVVGTPNFAAYSASKAGVIGLTKAVAKEVATGGVLVHAVSPGMVATPMNATGLSQREAVAAITPLGRIGEPREVAALVSWLISEECSFTTGHNFDISGGRSPL